MIVYTGKSTPDAGQQTCSVLVTDDMMASIRFFFFFFSVWRNIIWDPPSAAYQERHRGGAGTPNPRPGHVPPATSISGSRHTLISWKSARMFEPWVAILPADVNRARHFGSQASSRRDSPPKIK